MVVLRVTTILFLYILSVLGKAHTEFSVVFDNISIQNSRFGYFFEGDELFGKEGEPELPCKNISLLLPPDIDLQSVEVCIQDAQYKKIEGIYRIRPVAPLENSSTVREKGRSIPQANDEIYRSDKSFPEKIIRKVTLGKLHSSNITDIVLQKCRYNPVTGSIEQLVSATVDIAYTKDESRAAMSELPESAVRLLQSVVENPDAIERFVVSQRRKPTYLIITTASFRSQSYVLDTFIGIKENQGFNVEVITESTWGGGSGDSAMRALRSWLKNNYVSKGIEYVFIIGEPGLNTKIPMTHGPTNSDTNPLVDYCYADLSSARWSADYSDTDRLLDFDKYAELHVGRLPVYGGNVEIADKLLSRMVAYATESATSAESWRFNALMPMANFSDAQNGVVFGEAIKKNILSPAGWGQFRVYKDHMGIPAEGYPLSYKNTRDFWNGGKFGLMIWQGHGLPTKTFSGPMEYVMDSPTAAGIKSDYPSHCFQVSCHNGCPFNASNLAYALLKANAISTIASAVEIWYSAMNTNYGSQGNGNDFGYVYVKNLVEQKLPAASAFNATRATLPINGVQAWQNLTELNLYGCPATGVYTYGISDQVSVTTKSHTSTSLVKAIVKKGVLEYRFKNNETGKILITTPAGRIVYNDSFHGISHQWNYGAQAPASGLYIVRFDFASGASYSTKVQL